MKVFFEPWNLGDAIIAASVARIAPDEIYLACNSRWHEILGIVSKGQLRLLPLDLPYVWRSSGARFDLGKGDPAAGFPTVPRPELEIVNIRGDLRDWLTARRSFPGARFTFTGWISYAARWIPPVDIPFRLGILPVRNRYRAWAQAARIPFTEVEARYRETLRCQEGPVVVHIGAQWRSKQYPHVAGLIAALQLSGRKVELLGGPSDLPPPGVAPDLIARPGWAELVERLERASCVVANDSGPMHLAAILGCRTIALSRCSNIAEWLPPGVQALVSPETPKGYTPLRGYWTDKVLEGWPGVDEVVASINSPHFHPDRCRREDVGALTRQPHPHPVPLP